MGAIRTRQARYAQADFQIRSNGSCPGRPRRYFPCLWAVVGTLQVWCTLLRCDTTLSGCLGVAHNNFYYYTIRTNTTLSLTVFPPKSEVVVVVGKFSLPRGTQCTATTAGRGKSYSTLLNLDPSDRSQRRCRKALNDTPQIFIRSRPRLGGAGLWSHTRILP
jgi:hypothetical protein